MTYMRNQRNILLRIINEEEHCPLLASQLVPRPVLTVPVSSENEKTLHSDNKGVSEHVETVPANTADRKLANAATSGGARKNVGLAVLEQKHVIPTMGKRMPTTKWEYIFFCVFCT